MKKQFLKFGMLNYHPEFQNQLYDLFKISPGGSESN